MPSAFSGILDYLVQAERASGLQNAVAQALLGICNVSLSAAGQVGHMHAVQVGLACA